MNTANRHDAVPAHLVNPSLYDGWCERDYKDSMTEAQPSDALKNLVLSILVLAVLGTIIAVALLFGVKLPAQAVLEAPENIAPMV
jgi:hypothetical protein